MAAQLPTFRAALGAEFDHLAPVLRGHYDLGPGDEIVIRGRMRAWSRFPWLRLFLPFMPIPAESIDVVVRNRGVLPWFSASAKVVPCTRRPTVHSA